MVVRATEDGAALTPRPDAESDAKARAAEAVAERIPAVKDTTRPIGDALLTTYLVPFELASLVLLIAMLGAASIARKEIR